MHKPWIAGLLVFCAFGAVGCGPIQNSGTMVSGGQDRAVVPSHAPYRLSYPLKALAAGSDVYVYTGQPWRGRTVTIYAVPRENLVGDVSGYVLRSTRNLERIGSTSIQPDGLWTFRWRVQHERSVPNRELFLFARSDQGQYAITQVQHFVHHRP